MRQAISFPSNRGFRWIGKRLDVELLLDGCALPEEAADCVREVVRELRLWASEKEDVANELIAHFTDGIEDGTPVVDLVGRFGDARGTARLIARAKRRNRGWLWQSVRVMTYITFLLLAGYGYLAFRFVAAKPEPKVDYVAILNAEAKKVADADRAYPVYLEAFDMLMELEQIPDYLRHPVFAWEEINSDKIVQILEASRSLIGKVKEAPGKPHMGFLLRENQELLGPLIVHGFVDDLRSGFYDVAYLLQLDALKAADEGRAADATETILAMFAMGRHLKEVPFLLGSMYGVMVNQTSTGALSLILKEYPALFSQTQLMRFDMALSESEILLIDAFEAEMLGMEDYVQRIYTDDGRGGGFLTRDFMQFTKILQDQPEVSGPWSDLFDAVKRPVSFATSPNRRTFVEEMRMAFEVLKATASAESNLEREQIFSDHEAFLLEVTSSVGLPSPGKMIRWFGGNVEYTAEANRSHRALRLLIAAKRYRRENSFWPTEADDLSPAFLAEPLADEVQGGVLRLRVEDDHLTILGGGEESEILWP